MSESYVRLFIPDHPRRFSVIHKTNRRYRGVMVSMALIVPLVLSGILMAKEMDFSRSWSPTHSKALTRRVPNGPAGQSRETFATVTTSFFSPLMLVQLGESNHFNSQQEQFFIGQSGAISDLAVADFNGDGLDDFAIADFLNNSVELFLAKSEHRFVHAASIKVDSGPVLISADDSNGDGHPDISTVSFSNRSVSLARGTGDGHFAPATTPRRGLSGGPLFADHAFAVIDFATLRSAIMDMNMSGSTRQTLLKYLNRADKYYKRHNKQLTLYNLQLLLKYIKKVDDTQLKRANRITLGLMAKELIDQILAWRVSVDLTALPETVSQGQSSTLSWTSFNAISALIDHDVGAVPVTGSTTVTPSKTTAYTITVNNSDGLSALDSQIVKVTGGAKTIYVDAAVGDDTTGNGSMEKPFKSITMGLSIATTGYTVSAAEGVYDVDNGETFPLYVPEGVTLQGDGSTRTLISGGGGGGGCASACHSNKAKFPISSDVISGKDCLSSHSRTLAWVRDSTGIGAKKSGMGLTMAMNSNTVLDSVGLYGGGFIGLIMYGEGTTTVQNSRIMGYYLGAAAGFMLDAKAISSYGSVNLKNNIVLGNFMVDFMSGGYDLTASNCKFGSAMELGIIAYGNDNAIAMTGSTFNGNGYGAIIEGMVGVFRDNRFVDNLGVGVELNAQVDFGTDASHMGHNIFHNLGAGADCNFLNYDSLTLVYAVGNEWDNDPPTTNWSGTGHGYDIRGNGVNVKWQ